MKRSRRIGQIVRKSDHIGSDANGDSKQVFCQNGGFEQNAGQFRVINQNVVWPFEADCGRHGGTGCGKYRVKRIGNRQASNETKRCRRLHLIGFDKEKRGGKIAFRRGPATAPSAAPTFLFLRDKPELARITRRCPFQSNSVGGTYRLKRF